MITIHSVYLRRVFTDFTSSTMVTKLQMGFVLTQVCPFGVKIKMSKLQLLIWTAYEHDHNPANDTNKHMKVATEKKVKAVIAEAPIGGFMFSLHYLYSKTYYSITQESELHTFTKNSI